MKLWKLFFSSTAQIGLRDQDVAVLGVYYVLGQQTGCAADVYSFLKKNLGRDPRLPTVYQSVTKLRDLGLLEDVGEAPSHGGRPRRMFRLTQTGLQALSVADRMANQLGLAEAMVPA